MRVINLDETGIKLINNKKQQIYLSLDEVKSFVNTKNLIKDDHIEFNNLKLALSKEEIKDFNVIIKYLKSEILKQTI